MIDNKNLNSVGRSNAWIIIALGLVLVVVIAGYFLLIKPKNIPPGPLTKQQYQKVLAAGISQDLLLGEAPEKVSLVYMGNAKDGTEQTGIDFVANKSLPEIWSDYNGYFKDNNWTFAKGASTPTIPAESSDQPVIFSVSNSKENLVVYATSNGPHQTTVKISAFLLKK